VELLDVTCLSDELESRFADLFSECFDCSPSPGWRLLALELCEKLDAIGDVKISQLKSKLGEMRCSIVGPQEAHDVVAEYERRSRGICETCGAPGKQATRGVWILVACEECWP
jgi:hypothetical protein